jgi:hypothetical protein
MPQSHRPLPRRSQKLALDPRIGILISSTIAPLAGQQAMKIDRGLGARTGLCQSSGAEL